MIKAIAVVMTKTDKWEGARFHDGKFKRSFIMDGPLESAIKEQVLPFLKGPFKPGTSVNIAVNIEEEKDEETSETEGNDSGTNSA